MQKATECVVFLLIKGLTIASIYKKAYTLYSFTVVAVLKMLFKNRIYK